VIAVGAGRRAHALFGAALVVSRREPAGWRRSLGEMNRSRPFSHRRRRAYGDPVSDDSVLYDLDGAVATITLNRPESMNALTTTMKTALLETLEQAAADKAVRAVVLTGAGRGFCTGQDMREHAALLESAGVAEGDSPGVSAAEGAAAGVVGTVRLHYNPIVNALVAMPKPVIAAMNGAAAGAGAALALACDLRLAAENASLLMAFARVGLGPDSGASWTLQRLAGRAAALELLLLAEPVSAARLLELGLVTSVVPGNELAGAASGLAGRLADGPTAAYAAIKEAVTFSAAHGLHEALAKEADLQERLALTADHAAATQAFMRKQKPEFTGR
jgi:2-(1,2-epoxy-1,2-dihydrophenyl)acetyl-CoA isomerase